uniref:Uncharacterized protein n=1 Tax=Lepeophtheirus salmonis TaxID=72036 RepID=A0A0K2TEJ4_LEPSM
MLMLHCGKTFNSSIHAFVDCHSVRILEVFISLNVKGLNDQESHFTKGLVLFGLSKRKGSAGKTNALELALLNSKVLIDSKITNYEPLAAEEIRAVIISAIARYAAFSFMVPDISGSGWKYGDDVIRYYCSMSAKYLDSLKWIVGSYKGFKKK